MLISLGIFEKHNKSQLTKLRRQLNKQANSMNTTNFNRVLMTDDCLGHALGLRCRGALLFEDVERYPAAVDIE